MIDSIDSTYSSDDHATKNAELFSDKIRQILPLLTQIEISVSDLTTVKLNKASYQINYILQRITSGVTISHIRLSSYPARVPNKCIDSVQNLTNLSLYWSNDSLEMLDVIYKHKSTLERLLVKFAHGRNSTHIFVTPGNQVVCYPRLSFLELNGHIGLPQLNLVPKTKTFGSFPRLQHFVCGTDFPFADDIIFRDNHLFLESLAFEDRTSPLDALCNPEIFDITKMKALRKITLGNESFDVKNMFNPNYIDFFKKLPAAVQELIIYQSEIFDIFSSAILNGSKFPNLQYLKCGAAKLSLTTTMKILQAFPNLKVLENCLEGLGAGYEDMTHKQYQ
ncbi:hypothetical protein LPJ68_005420 [Coemansia sp. RSA 1086]|nr:hypothetical protein LPJ68_005420 [Coemansia sp. RSA 1086]